VQIQIGCTQLAAASDKIYQLLAHGRWFSPGTSASCTTKTGRHDIAIILLKVALNTITPPNPCDTGNYWSVRFLKYYDIIDKFFISMCIITARPIRLAVILVIMSVSTFKTVVLSIHTESTAWRVV